MGGSSSSGVKGVILLPCQASLSKVLNPAAHLRDGTTNVCDWLLLQMTLWPPCEAAPPNRVRIQLCTASAMSRGALRGPR